MRDKLSSALKLAGLAVAVFAVGGAGVWVGTLVRDRIANGEGTHVSSRAPRSLLRTGDAFPDVELTDADGNEIGSGELVGGSGRVILFIDLECPPCTDMCVRWQQAVTDGLIAAELVAGITYQPIDVAEAYRAEHALDFGVYRDAEGVFRREYEVTRFPLEVIVGASGRIRSTSYDSVSEIDPGVLASRLGD